MRLSAYYLPTLKEDPAEAEIVSHRLMVRAGMIRKLTSGIYSYLPYGYRSLQKISNIIRQEMDQAGCLEIYMPMVQPADLWQETNRWEHYGKELLRFKDRHGRDYCLGPTHEEIITDLLRHEIRSYKDLPINLYQIQSKFRDEIRPRFGLMRCREFVMKDGYSFDKDQAGNQSSYEQMFQVYRKIFQRMGLDFRAVEADPGAIGGSFSNEFMVLAETGEDIIVVCSKCEYAANLEKAELQPPNPSKKTSNCPELDEVFTPGMHTVQEVADFLGVSSNKILKTLLYQADDQPVAALVPGDRQLNELKLQNFLQCSKLALASPEQIRDWTGAQVGFSGPVNLEVTKVVADRQLVDCSDLITGANKDDFHFQHVDLSRDAKITDFTDLITVNESDPCPRCGAPLQFYKGIEVGHIFKLGTKYSQAMGATYLDEKGKEQEIIMGCYGIGVSRILAANIEQNHDQNGIIFPPPIAPFDVLLIGLNLKDKSVRDKTEEIYQSLCSSGIDVLLDDRDERPGFKFKDADLLGLPIQIIVGSKGLQQNQIEAKNRKTGQRIKLSLNNFLNDFQELRNEVWQSWGLD